MSAENEQPRATISNLQTNVSVGFSVPGGGSVSVHVPSLASGETPLMAVRQALSSALIEVEHQITEEGKV